MQHPRVNKVILCQMWTEPEYEKHPFYIGLIEKM